jgi:hypothetical protein
MVFEADRGDALLGMSSACGGGVEAYFDGDRFEWRALHTPSAMLSR